MTQQGGQIQRITVLDSNRVLDVIKIRNVRVLKNVEGPMVEQIIKNVVVVVLLVIGGTKRITAETCLMVIIVVVMLCVNLEAAV